MGLVGSGRRVRNLFMFMFIYMFVIFGFRLNSSYDICEFNFYLSVVILVCGVLVPDVDKIIARFSLC